MQKANRNVHLFDPAPCESAKLQAIGRTHRIGQRQVVNGVQYITPHTYATSILAHAAAQMAVLNLALVQPETLLRIYATDGTSDEDKLRIQQMKGSSWWMGNYCTNRRRILRGRPKRLLRKAMRSWQRIQIRSPCTSVKLGTGALPS
jgi:hypothetical protein